MRRAAETITESVATLDDSDHQPRLKRSRKNAAIFVHQDPTSPSPSPNRNTSRIIYADLTDDQKTRTLQHLITTTLDHKTRATAAAVVSVATEHHLRGRKRDVLIPLMRSHKCRWDCLVREADAAAAGEIQYFSQQPEEFDRRPIARPHVRKERELETASRAQRRAANASRVADINRTDIEWWQANWPQEESSEALKEVSRLHIEKNLSLSITLSSFVSIECKPLKKHFTVHLALSATAMSWPRHLNISSPRISTFQF